MPTWKDVIAIARELPQVEVSTWYGTPGLNVAGKGFARLRTEAEGGLVLLCSMDEKARLLESGDPAYFTTPHYDGYGSILVALSHITRDALRELIVSSWRIKATPKIRATADRVCYHCKERLAVGVPHDCWTTTERALTKNLQEDLRDAWERLRETAAGFGEQRIYASHKSIMFARKACYFFVRPQKRYLEVCVFLDRPLKAPQVRSVVQASRMKMANLLRIVHRDEVEAPITDWLKEAYELSDVLSGKRGVGRKKPKRARLAKTKRKAAVR